MGYLEDLQRRTPYRGAGQIAALWRGTITDVLATGHVRCRVPALGIKLALGPMPSLVTVAVGDPVLLGAISGNYADLMVIGFADSRIPDSGIVGRAVLASTTTAQARLAIALENVNNTSDAAKPVSTATQDALNLKQDTSTVGELIRDTMGTALVAQGSGVATVTVNDAGDTITIGTTATATGKAVFEAATQGAARTAIGAGTSSLIIGTNSTEAKAGDWFPTWTQVTSKPTTFAPIVGSGAADAKAGNWFPTWTEVTSKPSTFASDWSTLASKPSTFAPVVGSGAADAKAGNWFPTWTEVTSKPTTFAPIVGSTSVTAKAGNWFPDWTEVTGKPSTFAPSAHNHTAAETTSGTFAVARLPLVTTSVDGAMLATDKVILNNAVSTNTASRLVIRDASSRARFSDPSNAQDAATKAYVDAVTTAFTWRKMEWASGPFSVTGGQAWDVGPFTARTGTNVNVGASFATTAGASSGAIIITVDGFYLFNLMTSASSGDPGGGWARITLERASLGAPITISQAANLASAGAFSYEYECHPTMAVPIWCEVDDEIRCTYSMQSNHSVTSVFRAAKVGTSAAWGL